MAYTLLDLPVEIMDRIIYFVLRPDRITEYGDYTKTSLPARYHHPAERRLRERLQSAFINKELFKMALPAYFRSTHVNMIMTQDKEARVSFSTFKPGPLFYAHTMDLRVELQRNPSERFYKNHTFVAVHEILMHCSRLVHVTLCVNNLAASDREKLHRCVVDAMSYLGRNAVKEGRVLVVKEESEEEYAAEMTVREEANRQYEHEEKRELFRKAITATLHPSRSKLSNLPRALEPRDPDDIYYHRGGAYIRYQQEPLESEDDSSDIESR